MLKVFKHAKEGKITVMKEYLNITSDEERALYGISDALVQDCVFAGEADGESALKETSGLNVKFCDFHLRYPMWHMSQSVVENSVLVDTCRAPLWYDEGVRLSNCTVNGTSGEITSVSSSISASAFSALRIAALDAPRSELVFPVTILPSSSSIATEGVPVSSDFFIAGL